MKKITIELSDSDVEEGITLLYRASNIVDKLEVIVEDLQELKEIIKEFKKLH
jgi:hypothetical protein